MTEPSTSSAAVECTGENRIAEKILELCRECPNGVTQKLLEASMESVAAVDIANAVNKLLTKQKIEVLKQGSQLLYRLKNSKLKGTDNEEKIVYQIVEEAGNKGIWTREIRHKSNLSMTILNKVLKTMESKKLIKSVASVTASKKKVYMLYELEPDTSVSGGPWYTNQDFEVEFVDILNEQCCRYLQVKMNDAKTNSDPVSRQNTSYATSKDVWKYIKDLGISRAELEIEDIEKILETLVYDGLVEKHVVVCAAADTSPSETSNTVKMYRAVRPMVRNTGLMRMPCALCPVKHDCFEGGQISPSKCIYFKEWFEF